MSQAAVFAARFLRQQLPSTTARNIGRQLLFQSKSTTRASSQSSSITRRFGSFTSSSSQPRLRGPKPRHNGANQFRQSRFSSSSSSTSTNNSAQHQQQSFSQRMKTLSREYGWSAVGVYLALSALDFPLCFAAVQYFGVERIGHYEHMIVGEAKKLFYSVVPMERPTTVDAKVGHRNENETTEEGASIWTQLAIAYAVHKSLIFFRVPLTAAVTPKVVKTLRSWGWNIGKKTPKTIK